MGEVTKAVFDAGSEFMRCAAKAVEETFGSVIAAGCVATLFCDTVLGLYKADRRVVEGYLYAIRNDLREREVDIEITLKQPVAD
jgi:short-subunit dehydrogenase